MTENLLPMGSCAYYMLKITPLKRHQSVQGCREDQSPMDSKIRSPTPRHPSHPSRMPPDPQMTL